MDLALAIGRDVGSMSEREFARWLTYARLKGLPSRRLEYGLAMIALVIARVNGAKNAALSDFLFDPHRDKDGRIAEQRQPDHAPDIEAIKAAMGFNPR